MLLTFDTVDLKYDVTYHLKALDKYFSNKPISTKKRQYFQ